jgi:Ca2+-binding EF-hand superfamily protein
MADFNPKSIETMRNTINDLFKQFDDNGDQYLTPDEIYRAMQGCGRNMTLQDA